MDVMDVIAWRMDVRKKEAQGVRHRIDELLDKLAGEQDDRKVKMLHEWITELREEELELIEQRGRLEQKLLGGGRRQMAGQEATASSRDEIWSERAGEVGELIAEKLLGFWHHHIRLSKQFFFTPGAAMKQE